MGIIFVNVILTLMFVVVSYLGTIPAKMMYHSKDYQVMTGYLVVLTMLLVASIYVLVSVWGDGLRLLELRGNL